MANLEKKQIFSFSTKTETPYLELLAEKTGLSKMAVKRYFASGAVWIKEGKSDKRIRTVKGILTPNQRIKLYFDPFITEFDMTKIKCIHETSNWGVWYKPPGLLSQGTKYGDEYTILRHIETEANRTPFLVHRLDKETSGLMIVAYKKKSAAYFSEQIRENKIEKYYQTLVKGLVEEDSGEVTIPIEGKDALTKYKVLERRRNTTFVEAQIITGRKHQIRVHMAELGYPVLGDSKYGQSNRHKNGLQLVATRIVMKEPKRDRIMTFSVNDEDLLFRPE